MTKYTLLRGMGLMLAVGMVAGCATAPTQEMSDARQAVQAARDAGAPMHTPEAMEDAESDLTQAENKLRKREYSGARDEALAAKQQAVKARNMALAIDQAKQEVTKAEEMGAVSQTTREWLAQAETASAIGNEEEVVRATEKTKQEAQNDIQRFQEVQMRAEQENQAWLEKVPPLLDEVRQADERLSDEQREALGKAEEAYRQQQGQQAYDLINPVAEVVRDLPPLPRILQYQVVQGDNLWRIAARQSVYANALWWPLIYRSNHDQIPDADVLKPGLVLKIDLDPAQSLIELSIRHARLREGEPEKIKQLDAEFLQAAQ